MKSFLCVFMLFCAVRVVENRKSNDFELKDSRDPITVYWNVPSFQCELYKLNFSEILEKYGIRQNENDSFRGDKIVILYDPGSFPAIVNKGQETILRNGGVPQEGNLTSHLELFTESLEQLIPSTNFSGLGIIDFEIWRPIYRQNDYGTHLPHMNLSEYIERRNHPQWPDRCIKIEAAKRFEESAKMFMEKTLKKAKNLRPSASWGYYHYPYCFNMDGNLDKNCSKQVVGENNRTTWLFNESDNLYPSVYLKEAHNANQHAQMIEGRLDEALRIKKYINRKKNIYAYFWYKYKDTRNYLSKDDLFAALKVLANYDIDGVILWGAAADVNSTANCLQLYEYIDHVFGPLMKHAKV